MDEKSLCEKIFPNKLAVLSFITEINYVEVCKMKRIFLVFLAFLMCFTCNVSVSADYSKYTLHTDILAYINGAPIRSFNIDGFTGVVAEDLLQYGFGVYYNNDARKLEVIRLNNKITSDYVPKPLSAPVGSKDKKIYDTDIKTYVNGNLVTSFNIGGETIIFIDELMCYGQVIWYPNERKICYSYVENWSMDLYETDYTNDLSQPINAFALNWQRTPEGWSSSGENLDYLDYIRLYYDWQNGISFGFSLYQRTLFKTEELNNIMRQTITVGYDGEVISENADKANERVKIYINDIEQKITKVSQGKGNGHIDYMFHLDAKIDKEDIKKVTVICK